MRIRSDPDPQHWFFFTCFVTVSEMSEITFNACLYTGSFYFFLLYCQFKMFFYIIKLFLLLNF